MKAVICLVVFLYALTGHAGSLPEKSVYQLDINFEDQDETQLKFDSFRGKPILIGMIYASCPHVCPLTIHTIKNTENKLPEQLRRQLQVVLVSLDPETDNPALLKQIAERQQVDLTRWKLVRTDMTNVRKLAAVLGVRFRQLPDGEINHTTRVTLLNSEGEIIEQSDSLTTVDMPFLEKISEALKQVDTSLSR